MGNGVTLGSLTADEICTAVRHFQADPDSAWEKYGDCLNAIKVLEWDLGNHLAERRDRGKDPLPEPQPKLWYNSEDGEARRLTFFHPLLRLKDLVVDSESGLALATEICGGPELVYELINLTERIIKATTGYYTKAMAEEDHTPHPHAA